MEITQSIDTSTGPSCYSLEALLLKAGIYSQQKIFTRIEGLVRVKGIVTKVSRYKTATYLTLKDQEFSVSVKCDSTQDVYENELILVEGILYLKPSTFFVGLECCIHGNIVGSWEAAERSITKNHLIPKKKRFISLDNVVNDGTLSGLLLLGTETGINDALSQLDKATAKSISQAIIRVGRTDNLLEDIRAAAPHNFRAFIIVRGGDDNTMEIWNDPEVITFLLHYDIPFYTALGHSHSRTLTDQYADSFYPTPTAFGSALNSIMTGKRRFKEMETEYTRLKQEYILLASPPQPSPTPSKQSHDWVKIIAVFTTCSLLVYLFISTLF
ncbi:exodeoxyribonuclease VII large subunit [Cellvibrio fibrivorans]|uniref:Exonuclease VII large subunit C-terminal domain-containing protein n=1 Tax=Cellvibrio fibrivorans TaxID=126350 RepID=A0ABU1UTP5_9GAMM|nr:exodeoxyribonuclease VII large subunit [Cellvibrio fibrivorans]MDR7088546.1 hypothetical protein [Cellvibrio fibrivorans]